MRKGRCLVCYQLSMSALLNYPKNKDFFLLAFTKFGFMISMKKGSSAHLTSMVTKHFLQAPQRINGAIILLRVPQTPSISMQQIIPLNPSTNTLEVHQTTMVFCGREQMVMVLSNTTIENNYLAPQSSVLQPAGLVLTIRVNFYNGRSINRPIFWMLLLKRRRRC